MLPKKLKRLSDMQLIALGFLLLILGGTCLLMLALPAPANLPLLSQHFLQQQVPPASPVLFWSIPIHTGPSLDSLYYYF